MDSPVEISIQLQTNVIRIVGAATQGLRRQIWYRCELHSSDYFNASHESGYIKTLLFNMAKLPCPTCDSRQLVRQRVSSSQYLATKRIMFAPSGGLLTLRAAIARQQFTLSRKVSHTRNIKITCVSYHTCLAFQPDVFDTHLSLSLSLSHGAVYE